MTFLPYVLCRIDALHKNGSLAGSEALFAMKSAFKQIRKMDIERPAPPHFLGIRQMLPFCLDCFRLTPSPHPPQGIDMAIDIVRQKQIREWTLLGLVATMALVANLPRTILDGIGIEQGLLMAMLGLMVVFALFLYVRFFFFLIYFLLAIGANLPEQWAASLGISQTPMLIALIAMVALSVLNYSAKALPTGLEPKKRKPNPEATQMLADAIDKRNRSYFKTLLTMDFDVDLPSPDGMTPLMKASRLGDFKMVQMLIRRGASTLIEGPSGRASDVALKHNFPKVAEFLTRVETVHAAEAEKLLAKQPKTEPAIA
jgi:hypothetical protein